MVITPKGKPALGTLNSFYVVLDRLIEHCQGALGAGCIHLRAPRAQAAIFFEGVEVAQTVFEAPGAAATGPGALEQLFAEVPRGSYAIDVFELDPALLHFWAALATAERVEAAPNSDATDLQGLIERMDRERLSGCIEVHLRGASMGAILLLDEGQVIGGSYALGEERRGNSLETLYHLWAERGGTVHVNRLPDPGRQPVSPAPSRPPPDEGPSLTLVEQVLAALESVVGAEKSVTAPFSTLLRAKFLAKAATYDFLDPFAAEFTYAGGKVRFAGRADRRLVAQAVGECVTELAGELRVSRAFRALLQDRFGAQPAALSLFGLAA